MKERDRRTERSREKKRERARLAVKYMIRSNRWQTVTNCAHHHSVTAERGIAQGVHALARRPVIPPLTPLNDDRQPSPVRAHRPPPSSYRYNEEI